MNGHRFQINHGGNQLLYKHFNLPDHSILSMKVRILEKIYHPTNNPNLSTPFRRKREEYWIRQLETAAPSGCNDHIDSIGNLTSPGCQLVNVLNLFNRTSRSHRSHGLRRYNKPDIHYVSFDFRSFNYKASLQLIDFDGLSHEQNPTPCSCCDSEFLNAPCGHIVTGDLSIVRYQKLKDVLCKGPKYREPVSFSWHQSFNIIMDACEEYARRWAKKEDVEVDTLFEWVKSIADVWNVEFDDLNALSTPDTSPFSVTLRLSENFPVSKIPGLKYGFFKPCLAANRFITPVIANTGYLTCLTNLPV